VTVDVKVEGLEEIARKPNATREVIQRAIDRTAVDIEGQVKYEVDQHQRDATGGSLSRSVFKARVDGGWEVGNDSQLAPHARFVHDGSRPHVIRPRERKLLRWPVPGGYAFARQVNHPGYKGDPWLARAAREAPLVFERYIQSLMSGQQ
jgi:hypothetical protein